MESFSRWLDPLLFALVAIGVGLFLRARFAPASERRGRLALIGATTAWAVLWVVSTPVVTYAVIRRLEPPPGEPLAGLGAEVPAAIVILGAGLKTDQHDVPLRECLNEAGTARIMGGARLYASHPNAFVILSGGPPIEAEAALDLALHEGIPRERIEVEPASANTRENAANSMAIVKKRALERVIVVTSAMHMHRSLDDFRRLGVTPTAAPVDYLGRRDRHLRNWFPDSIALGHFYRALHELLGAFKP